MSKKKKIIGVVCGVVAVAVVGGYLLLNQNSGAAVMVSTETLQQMDLQNTVSLTGVVESETDRKVYSTLSYLVESVNVQVGDVVQAGDVLAQLDTEQLEMDIAQQQAVHHAPAIAHIAQDILERGLLLVAQRKRQGLLECGQVLARGVGIGHHID